MHLKETSVGTGKPCNMTKQISHSLSQQPTCIEIIYNSSVEPRFTLATLSEGEVQSP